MDTFAQQLLELEASIDPKNHASHAIIARMRRTITSIDPWTMILGSSEEIGNSTFTTPIPAVVEVFSTTELLESILDHLPTLDLLKSYSVNRTFFNTIEGSLRIQRRMGLVADPAAMISLPLSRVGWTWAFSIERSEPTHTQISLHDQTSESPFWFVFNFNAPLGVLGSRLGKILLCQPPVHELHLYAGCCAKCIARVKTVKGSVGLRLQDVNHILTPLWDGHRLCPFARRDAHDRDGFVQPSFTLRGRIEASESAIAAKLHEHEQADRVDQACATELARYICAKRTGECAGHLSIYKEELRLIAL